MYKSLLFTVMLWIASLSMAAATYPASYYTLASEGGAVPGDVNGDGECTGSDVTALYNYILYNDNSAMVNGDQNNDGDVTGSDVTAVYNIILGTGGGTIAPTSIKMKDYQNVTSSYVSDYTWTNVESAYYGDVIYITLDGVEQNMYVLVRTGGKWALKDVGGNSKAGFKSSGNLKAMWVRGGYWNIDQVYDIRVPYDYALGSGTYTLTGTTVSINLNLTLAESKVVLTGSMASMMANMTYCSRVNHVYDINAFSNGETGEFIYGVEGGKSTVMHIGNEYCVFGEFTDVSSDGKTIYHVTDPNGRSWSKMGTGKLNAGRMIGLANPYPYDGSNGWSRDFVMTFWDWDDTYTRQRVVPDLTKTIHMLVGTEITFAPQEGGMTASDGTTTSRYTANSNVVTASASTNNNSTMIKAVGVGEAYVTFTYRTSQGESFDFYVRVYVQPAVWLAGSANGKPVLYRNNTVKYSSLSVSANRIDQVFVRNGTAYIRASDSSNPNAAPYIMRSTNPVYGGSFIQRLNTPMEHFLVTKNGDMWYTNGKNVYKGSTLVHTRTGNATITDLKQDESSSSGAVWISGYTCADPTKSASSDIAWLATNLDGNALVYNMPTDRITTDLGGYQPGTQTYTGYRSPHFGKMTIQYNFVLIDGFDIEEHGYRDYYGKIHESYYTVDKTYTYDSSNGFLRQNNVKYYGDFFFEDQTNERVFFIDGTLGGTLKYHNLRTNVVNDVNSSIPRVRLMRYVNGSIYALTDNTSNRQILYGTPTQFFNGTYRTINISGEPYIYDMFVETSVNN